MASTPNNGPPEPSSSLEETIASLNISGGGGHHEPVNEPEETTIETITSSDTPYTSANTFEELNLSEALLKGLYVEMRFARPSKIQAKTLPMILTPPYKDLVAQAHNGSGKTTCFVLGMLSRVDPNLKAPQAICVSPTRELAIQNLEVLRKMGKYTGITSELAVPVESKAVGFSAINHRPPVSGQVVIGTPGTIKRLVSTRKLGLGRVKILVFDEADQMIAEGGFKDDSLRLKKSIEKLSRQCQVLLFSATFNETVKSFVSRVVDDHNELYVKKENLTLAALKQYTVACPNELAKIQLIKERIFDLGENIGQRIIFVRTKASALMLHKELVADGYAVTTIQGANSPEERDKIMSEFRAGLTQVLISTDILARGFDQKQVNLVINYDLPINHFTREPEYEVYLHRIGRAGRFGKKGAVFNFICGDEDEKAMRKIELYFQNQTTEVKNTEEDFESALKQAGLF